MQWWEETVHALVVMYDWKQQKKLEGAIREMVQAVTVPKRARGFLRTMPGDHRSASGLTFTWTSLPVLAHLLLPLTPHRDSANSSW